MRICKQLSVMIILLVVQVISGENKAYATHAAGTDLTYSYIGNNQYMLEVSFYRDCAGVDEPDSAAIQCKSVNCNQNFTVYAIKVAGTGQEITTPCNAATTTCNGGTFTGIKRFVYRKVVTLSACSDWVFSFHECCRNCSITTISNPCGNNSELYVEAKLNNVLAPGNSSPSFSNLPIAFVCVGQNFTYNHGVLDTDGDSLSYSLMAPKISAGSNVSFIAPATASSPLSSSTPFAINNITGDINFTPNALQIGVMAVLIKEYRNGQLIGSVIRDMQVYTQSCNNAVPVASGIDSTSNFSVTVCPDQTLCFDIYAADTDASQHVTMTTNNGIPGATYTISGGSRPVLHFCWTPTFADASLLPNTFTVTVRDNACPSNGIQTFSYSVFVPSPYFNVSGTSISCSGGNNGSVMATPVYGNTYSYLWNTVPSATTASVTGLTAGTYTVTVSDNNQCSATASVTLTAPSALDPDFSTLNPLCNGSCNGSIDLSVQGGVEPYVYLWSNNSQVMDQVQLCAGTYSVTITDANGCTASESAVLSEPDLLTAAITGTNISCNGLENGSADLHVSGGTPGYQYSWSNSSTVEDITGLPFGTYTVFVYDEHQCSATAQVTISEPAALSILLSGTEPLCFGATGLIDLSLNGGITPCQFLWSNGETTEDISGIIAGTYTVNVSDANQCTATAIIVLEEPAQLFVNIISSDGTCTQNTGSADLTANGGTAPYSYLWSNGETTEDLTNLASGTYSVTVTDAHGCAVASQVTIQSSNLLNAVAFSSGLLCHGDHNGTIDLSVSGGQPPYLYLWSNGATTEDLSFLPAGNYTVSIYDASLCSFTAAVTMYQPDALGIIIFGNSAICNAGSGTADLTVTGGTPPYLYAWTNGETSEDLQQLVAGTYTVTVTDANGCSSTEQTIIDGVSSNLLVGTLVQDVLCNGNADGNIFLTVSGGTSPYTFLWSDGSTLKDLLMVNAGIYQVTVTDFYGCSQNLQAVVSEPQVMTATITGNNGSCQGSQGNSADLSVSGGTTPYSFLWSNGETSEDLSNVATGTFTVTVTDANGCSVTESIILSGNSLSVTFTVSPATCSGNSNGSVVSMVTGGTAPYNFIWSNGETTQDIFSLAAGSYQVTITDFFKCMVSASIVVAEPEPLDIKILAYDVTCLQDGSVNSLASGGTEPYSYLWSDGSTSQNIPAVPAGTYTVTVTDANGCSSSASVTVNAPLPIYLTFVTIDASAPGASDGSIDLAITGGIAPYSYLWTNGETTEDLFNLSAGLYEVIVTDAQGCHAKALITINEVIKSAVMEQNNGISIRHFPNPATSVVHFLINLNENGKIRLDLYTVEGKLVSNIFNGTLNKNSNHLIQYDIKGLGYGMYFYRITSGDKYSNNKLLISKE